MHERQTAYEKWIADRKAAGLPPFEANT